MVVSMVNILAVIIWTVAFVADVHQSADLAEVELISVVQEQIPSYKLRTDPAALAAGRQLHTQLRKRKYFGNNPYRYTFFNNFISTNVITPGIKHSLVKF